MANNFFHTLWGCCLPCSLSMETIFASRWVQIPSCTGLYTGQHGLCAQCWHSLEYYDCFPPSPPSLQSLHSLPPTRGNSLSRELLSPPPTTPSYATDV